ncbi:uncharacterized protein LOC131070364 [Cryptomeria japonica]|uniref:uncharacterized protein LOC131070364 n=1 Tax=Cryptomeria japonica TaxID=3369 RepID=UPI0027DA3B16|nr:uncharacterized protein LOC131070364 [Cryptomeria japonica]
MILGSISCLQNPIFGEASKGILYRTENFSFSPRHVLVRQSPHTMSTRCYCSILGTVSHTACHSRKSVNPERIDCLTRIPQKFHRQNRIQKGFTLFRGYKSSNFDYGKKQVVLSSLSSFAEPDGEDIERNYFDKEENKDYKISNSTSRLDKGGAQNQKVQGMSEAFNISPQTAFAISGSIALAALVLPLLMKSLGHGLPMKTKSLSYLTLLCGFYMAWNIGANDVANAMGTSVGSGALTLRQAVLIAGFLEFSGAFLMGSHVSSTMQNGILVANVFNGKDSLLFAGMLSSLASAGTWLQLEDSREHTQPGFDEHAPLPPIKWSTPEHTDLTTLMRPVMTYTKWWVNQKCHRLKQKNITLTYNLMGVAEGYSSNEEATQNARPSESAKRKGKAVENEELAQKKKRIEPSRSATSRNEKYILTIDESLAEIKIPSSVHERNAESVHQEDE